jgi:glucosamine--fructose-6-phosphate aminotransferase (isomerizing)
VSLHGEIMEQPSVARRLLERGREPIAAMARALRERPIDYLVIAARGSSDHAAIYAQYLFGVRHRLPVALAAPSIRSLYGVEPRFERALVIGISQSGASPDVVGIVQAARGQGAPTIAVTNDASSPLAEAAEFVLEVQAGAERSIAATKTYTAQLLGLALLSAALLDDPQDERAIDALPDALATALDVDAAARQVALRQATMTRCIVLGRGFEYATAREWALKLKELTAVVADPYSAADFQHGPIALVEPGFPVLAVVPSGAAAEDLLALLARLRAEQGADVLAISDLPDTLGLGEALLPSPAGVPEWLQPIVTIVPAQLHAYHLTLARGRDPEAPRNLSKVTLTR